MTMALGSCKETGRIAFDACFDSGYSGKCFLLWDLCLTCVAIQMISWAMQNAMWKGSKRPYHAHPSETSPQRCSQHRVHGEIADTLLWHHILLHYTCTWDCYISLDSPADSTGNFTRCVSLHTFMDKGVKCNESITSRVLWFQDTKTAGKGHVKNWDATALPHLLSQKQRLSFLAKSMLLQVRSSCRHANPNLANFDLRSKNYKLWPSFAAGAWKCQMACQYRHFKVQASVMVVSGLMLLTSCRQTYWILYRRMSTNRN